MPHAYHEIAFTPAVKARQGEIGSRRAYARMEGHEAVVGDRLTAHERVFITARDSFYMATVGSNGWPYVQHRGGAPGFVKILDDHTLGFADYVGNKQRVSEGNAQGDDRAALIFMDYPNRGRLKMYARIEAVRPDARADLEEALLRDAGEETPEPQFAWLVHVEAVDWNCPKYITPRFAADDVRAVVTRLEDRIGALEARLKALGEEV